MPASAANSAARTNPRASPATSPRRFWRAAGNIRRFGHGSSRERRRCKLPLPRGPARSESRSQFLADPVHVMLNGRGTQYMRDATRIVRLFAVAFPLMAAPSVIALAAEGARTGRAGTSEVVFLCQITLLLAIGRLLGEAMLRIGQ